MPMDHVYSLVKWLGFTACQETGTSLEIYELALILSLPVKNSFCHCSCLGFHVSRNPLHIILVSVPCLRWSSYCRSSLTNQTIRKGFWSWTATLSDNRQGPLAHTKWSGNSSDMQQLDNHSSFNLWLIVIWYKWKARIWGFHSCILFWLVYNDKISTMKENSCHDSAVILDTRNDRLRSSKWQPKPCSKHLKPPLAALMGLIPCGFAEIRLST